MEREIYHVGAVVNGIRTIDRISAVSIKQAKYLFSRKFSYVIRDFTVYGIETNKNIRLESEYKQMKFKL